MSSSTAIHGSNDIFERGYSDPALCTLSIWKHFFCKILTRRILSALEIFMRMRCIQIYTLLTVGAAKICSREPPRLKGRLSREALYRSKPLPDYHSVTMMSRQWAEILILFSLKLERVDYFRSSLFQSPQMNLVIGAYGQQRTLDRAHRQTNRQIYKSNTVICSDRNPDLVPL